MGVGVVCSTVRPACAANPSHWSNMHTKINEIKNPENRSIIEEYVLDRSTEVKPKTLRTYLDPLCALAAHLGERGFQEATRKDVKSCILCHRGIQGPKGRPGRPLAASTRYQWGVHLSTFYQWLSGGIDAPECVRKLGFKKVDAMSQRGKEMALKPAEVRALLAGARNARDKAIIATLLETGFRASELAAIELKDVEIRSTGYWIQLPNRSDRDLKTGQRDHAVPVILSKNLLRDWLQVHPAPLKEGANLFVNLANRSFGSRMKGASVGAVVSTCAKRAGIRHVHAHMLRHTSATFKVAVGMPNELIRKIHGWSKNSTMLNYYTHMTPHFESMIIEFHGVSGSKPPMLDLLGSHGCAKCGMTNTVFEKACAGCGVLLCDSIAEGQRSHEEGLALKRVIPGVLDAFKDQLVFAVARAKGFSGGVA
jgi:integrase